MFRVTRLRAHDPSAARYNNYVKQRTLGETFPPPTLCVPSVCEMSLQAALSLYAISNYIIVNYTCNYNTSVFMGKYYPKVVISFLGAVV